MDHARARKLLAPILLALLLLGGGRAIEGTSSRSRPERLLFGAAKAVTDDLVLYRLRDRVLTRSPGGRRAVELFYDHIGGMGATVVANPQLGNLGVSWLESWEAPLTALVEGRGAQATLTQAQVNSLLAYVEAMKAAADPALRQALAREQARLDIPSWAGMRMSDWMQQRVNRLSCAPSDRALCLAGGRFRVEARWRTPDGKAAGAHAVPLTADTGYFWFFGDANVEAIVKVVDGCALNQRRWVFAGGLTNVEVDLTVADTWTGNSRTYRNPIGTPFQPLQDTAAFRGCAAAPPGGAAGALALPPVRPPVAAPGVPLSGGKQSCVPSAEVLCLQGGRFRVETEWERPNGTSGRGQAVPLTADTGYFWFFAPDNVEEVVKLLDACALNSRRWVFAAGLTNVRVVTRVTDTHTGAVKVYTNPQGRPFRPLQDTQAFGACG